MRKAENEYVKDAKVKCRKCEMVKLWNVQSGKDYGTKWQMYEMVKLEYSARGEEGCKKGELVKSQEDQK